MPYWIREFEKAETGERFRVYSEAQYVLELRRQVAEHLMAPDWSDDQIYRHNAGLDIKLDGKHPLEISQLSSGEMRLKTADQLEQECLRLLRSNMFTREIERVGIVRTHQTGRGPNWTYGELYPEPTRLGMQEADKIVASVAGRWALADG